jgi:hypothetical protein
MPTPYSKVEKLAAAWPGVERSTSYGTPALKVRGKLMARLREDEVTLVLRTTWDERERLMATYPGIFFVTDHYLKYPWLLVNLATVRESLLRTALEQAWRLVAPKSLLKKAAGSQPDQ